MRALAVFAALVAARDHGVLGYLLRRPAFPRGGFGPWTGAAAGLAAFAGFHLAVIALAPPASWDSRAYHLALPELYLKSGRLVEIPWLLHSHWPHLMSALYSLPLAAGSDGAAALLHAGACSVLAGGVFLAGGWPALLVLIGQPALLRVAPTAHADGACALLFFAAALALSRWEDGRGRGWLAAAGFLAGSAASAKLFGAAGAAAWTAWLALRERRGRDAAVFAGCAAVAAGPWLLRTWLDTGDPLWPLLRLGPAAAELAARNARSNLWLWPPPPWLLTHDGPLFLLAPLLLALALRHHEAWRYMIPVYAAAALACGRFASAAFSAGGPRRAAAAALILLGASPVLGLTQNNQLFAVLGLSSAARPDASPRALYEDLTVDVSSFYREAKGILPPGSKVLLFREVRGYGAGFDYLWGDPLNQNLVEYRRLGDPEALRARLRELGVTHVLDHAGSHLYGEDPLYYDARTLTLMASMLRSRARPALVRDGIVLHELL